MGSLEGGAKTLTPASSRAENPNAGLTGAETPEAGEQAAKASVAADGTQAEDDTSQRAGGAPAYGKGKGVAKGSETHRDAQSGPYAGAPTAVDEA